MRRTQKITLTLLFTLISLASGAWGGLRQWWDSLSMKKQAIYICLFFCAVAGLLSHFTGINPLLCLAALICLRLFIYLVQFLIFVCRI